MLDADVHVGTMYVHHDHNTVQCTHKNFTVLKNVASNFTAIYYVCEFGYINENIVCARQSICEHCTIAHIRSKIDFTAFLLAGVDTR